MKAKEIIGEGLGSLIGKGLVNLGSKMAGKGAAAAKAAEPVAAKAAKAAEPVAAANRGPGVSSEVTKKVTKWALDHPVKAGIIGATAYNLANDPDLGKKDIPSAIGGALGKTFTQGKKLAGAAWDSATRDDDTAVATTPGGKTNSDQASKPSSSQSEKEFSNDVDHPVAAPEPDSGNYIQDMERRIQKNFDRWPGQQNESVKKKFAIAEAENVDIDKELEKHFPDPYVRRAIAAKVSRESGGKNVGEVSYRNTSNDRIREKFPQLRRYSDSQLNALKKDDKQFFDTAYSKIGGYQYRGRGPIQITGRANYERLDKDLGLNGALVKDPDLLLKDPAISKAATLQYLKNAGLNKTYSNQKDAHRAVIAAIGGSAYAPGTQLGKSELAAVSGNTGDTKIAGIPASGGAAKPTNSSGAKILQMPDFSKGYKVGDKFIPLTDKGRGEPTDYTQAYTKAKQSMGYSPDEMLRQANAELLAKRSGLIPPKSEPASVLPKTAVTPEPSTKSVVPTKSKDDKETGSWDKVKTSSVPLEEQVTKHINKEIQDILRLSGKQ